MLHIIWILLKIIGILLLSVLGLILLLLLTTLLVPIRYRVEIEHGENLFYLKGRVNWLLHLLHVSVSHIDGLLHIKARVFGFVIYDNLAPKKPKKPKIVKKKEAKSKTAKSKTAKSKTVKSKATKIKAVKSKVAKSKELVDKQTTTATLKESSKVTIVASEEPQKSISTVPEEQQITVSMVPEEQMGQIAGENPISREAIQGNSVTEMQVKSSEASKDNVKSTILIDDVGIEEQKSRKSFFKKILERIQGIKDKTTSAFEVWKLKLSRILSTIATFKYKFDLILSFLKDEMNKEGMRVTFTSLKRMLKHILPTKLRSKIIFGTGDPCSTGQALGALSILYSFYGDKIQITPDFERNRLEGKHFVMGRIRLGTILIIVVKLIFDKKFKQLKNNFMILKEAL